MKELSFYHTLEIKNVTAAVQQQKQQRTRDKAQQLREFAALAEDPGSVPSTHMGAHNHP